MTIDGITSQSLSSNFEIATVHDDKGMPMMASLQCSINIMVDMHDDENMEFTTLAALYNLANVVTRDKIKDIKIEFWKDDAQRDALCTYTFKGWISLFSTTSGAGSNHTLRLQLQPTLNQQQFIDVKMGN